MRTRSRRGRGYSVHRTRVSRWQRRARVLRQNNQGLATALAIRTFETQARRGRTAIRTHRCKSVISCSKCSSFRRCAFSMLASSLFCFLLLSVEANAEECSGFGMPFVRKTARGARAFSSAAARDRDDACVCRTKRSRKQPARAWRPSRAVAHARRGECSRNAQHVRPALH